MSKLTHNPKGSSKISAILFMAGAGGENHAQAWLCEQGTAQVSLAHHKREQRQSLGSTGYSEHSLYKGFFSAHASGSICSSGGSRSHTLVEKRRGRRLWPTEAGAEARAGSGLCRARSSSSRSNTAYNSPEDAQRTQPMSLPSSGRGSEFTESSLTQRNLCVP